MSALPVETTETTQSTGSVTAAGDNRPLRRRADVTLKLSTPRK